MVMLECLTFFFFFNYISQLRSMVSCLSESSTRMGKFAEWGEDFEVNVAKVDVTEQPGLSGRFSITALPTIYRCNDGEFRCYQGPRT